ncbi:MAG: hypothetical protein HDQ88_00855, partial [Clostridia bacterium]|nr:hypothetical protein [Clostridia bacterium]
MKLLSKGKAKIITLVILIACVICAVLASFVLLTSGENKAENIAEITAPDLEVKTTATTTVSIPAFITDSSYASEFTFNGTNEATAKKAYGDNGTSSYMLSVSPRPNDSYCTVTSNSSRLSVTGMLTVGGMFAVQSENGDIIPPGTYTVTCKLNSGCVWEDGTTSDKYLRMIIPKATLSAQTVNFGTIGTQTYNNTLKTPTPSITFKNVYREANLVNNTDFTYSYSNNLSAGTATVTVTGTGKYQGSASTTFKIGGKALTSAMIGEVDPVFYDGTSKTPGVTVTDSALSKTLTAGTDFTYSCTNNLNAGTATITYSGIGNYTGTVTKTFEIKAKDVSSVTVNDVNPQVYTGTAKTPTLTVKDGTRTMTLNTDYTVEYANNINAGSARATITGKGNYEGEKVIEFTISERNIVNASISSIETYIFNGAEKTPTPEVTDGDKTLVEGVDFEFAYANNINVGEASIMLLGVGNYAGTKTAHFTIRTADLTDATVTLAQTPLTYDGTAKNAEISSVKIGTILLVQGRDYTVRYLNNINAGTASIILTGAGDYGGTQTVTYTIKPADISDAEVAGVETSYDYTGSAIKPNPELTLGERTLAITSDYTVEYADNVDLGRATVTLTGTGNYTGSKTVHFTIERASISAVARVTGIEESYEYTGSAVKPEPVVTFGEVTLEKGVDYAVNYTNNVLVGTATLKVTGIGNFDEEIIIEFEIDKATADIEIQYISYDGTATLYTGGNTPSIRAIATIDGNVIEGSVSWIEGSTSLASGEREYTWKFIPTESEHYKTQTGTITLTAVDPELDRITVEWNNGATQPNVFTTTDLEDIISLITVKGVKTDGTDYGEIENYEVIGSWNYGVSEEDILPAPLQGGTYDITVIYEDKEYILQGVVYQDVTFTDLDVTHADGRQIKKSYTALDTFDNNSIKVIAHFSNGDQKTINFGTNGYEIAYQGGRDKLYFGDEKITVSYTFGETTITREVDGLEIAKKKLNLTMLDEVVTYDGEAHTITVTGKYDEAILRVTYNNYKINGNAEEFISNPADVKNAGEYKVKATFTLLGEDNILNYEALGVKEAKLTITRATYGEGITFSKLSADYDDGKPLYTKIEVRNLPDGVEATFRYFDENGYEIDKDDVKDAGKYKIKVNFTVGENYMPIQEITTTFTVNKINPTVAPTVGGQTVAGTKVGNLFLISGDNDTAGTFKLDRTEEVLFEGLNRLYYTFTPEDTVNFNPISFYVDIPVEKSSASDPAGVGGTPVAGTNGGTVDGTLLGIVIA